MGKILKKNVGETLVMHPRYADLDESGDYGPQWKFKDDDGNILYVSAKYNQRLQAAGVLDADMEFVDGSGFSYTAQDKAKPIIKALGGTGAPKPNTAATSVGTVKMGHSRPEVTWQTLEDRMRAAFIAAQHAIPAGEDLSEEGKLKIVVSLFISAADAHLGGIPVPPIKSLAEELLDDDEEELPFK